MKESLVHQKWTEICKYTTQNDDSETGYAAFGTGMPGTFGSVTDRRSSNEKTRPKKCERIVLAEACKSNMMQGSELSVFVNKRMQDHQFKLKIT